MKHSLNYLFIYFLITTNFVFLTNAASQDFVVHQESDIGPFSVSNIDGVTWSSAIATNEENGNIYWAYISPDMKAVIARKDAQTGEVSTHVIHEKVKDDDNHAELSIGLDSDGYIHYLGNHHNSSPNYYISDNPDDISSWTFKGNDFENGGLQGIGITYQSFYRSLTGTLFVAYRSQVHSSAAKGTRSIALGKYETSTKKWTMIGSLDYCFDGLDCKEHCGSDLGITAFVWDNSGSGGGSCLSCGNYGFYQGYKLIVAFDENNMMHCTWNLSKNVFTTSNPAEFHTHVMYACSPDEGDTWFRADGSQIKKLPITCDTGDDEQDGDVVFTKLPQGYPNTCDTPTEEWTMTNQGNIFPDSDGKPIISCTVLTRTGNFNATESHYLQWNGAEWQDITKDFNLRGNIFSNHDGIMFAFEKNKIYITNNSGQTISVYDTDYRYNWNIFCDKYYLLKTGKLRYYAKNTDDNTARIVTLTASNGASRPDIQPGFEVYSGTVEISLSTKPADASIRYTTDGSEPSETDGDLYTVPFSINKTTLIKAIAYRDGLQTSNIAEKKYYVTEQCMSQLDIVAVEASTYQDPNIYTNTLDDNYETRWSAEGEQWIQYDLGTVKTINALFMSLYGGRKRHGIFDIQTSVDNESWHTEMTNVYSSGTTSFLEKYEIPETKARYLRINGHGNSTSGWNSMTKVLLWGGCQNVEIPQFELTAESINGSIEINPDGDSFESGSSVTITAIPEEAYNFLSWEGDIIEDINPLTFAMTANRQLTAHFQPKDSFNVKTIAQNGRIDLNPGGSRYMEGTVVQVTAIPDDGYSFNGWRERFLNDADSSQELTVNEDMTIKAYFETVSSVQQQKIKNATLFPSPYKSGNLVV